ncbi:MAG TPA: hypothetical protein VFF68_01540, partial [Anaerolineaceae bacterium]|nr:hypothetical protein [Anaerolineaceae bacterium]
MTTKKTFHLLMLFLVAVSLVFGGNGLVFAQNPPPPNGNKVGEGQGQGQDKKITHADRVAAAERAAEGGLELAAMGEAAM